MYHIFFMKLELLSTPFFMNPKYFYTSLKKIIMYGCTNKDKINVKKEMRGYFVQKITKKSLDVCL